MKHSLLILILLFTVLAVLSQEVDSTSAFRSSDKAERSQLPPTRYDTLSGRFIIYWNATRAHELGRTIDTMESKVYISLSYTPFDTILKETIEFGKHDITPDQTDSILYTTHTAYPSKSHQVWLFPVGNQGKVPLFSARHDTLILLHYGFDIRNIYLLPQRDNLILPRDTLGTHFIQPIADSLARVPRAFFEYSNSVEEALRIYNATPPEAYLPAHGSQTVAHMMQRVFSLKKPEKNLSLINALLLSDPENPIALLRMVEAHAEKQFPAAQKYFNRLEKVLSAEDYLLLYAQALLFDAQSDKTQAQVFYQKAQAKTVEGSPIWKRLNTIIMWNTKHY